MLPLVYNEPLSCAHVCVRVRQSKRAHADETKRAAAAEKSAQTAAQERDQARCLPHLTLTSPQLTTPQLTSAHLTSAHLTTPHLTTPYLASPDLTSRHLSTSLLLSSPENHVFLLCGLCTSPHTASPHLTILRFLFGCRFRRACAPAQATQQGDLPSTWGAEELVREVRIAEVWFTQHTQTLVVRSASSL